MKRGYTLVELIVVVAVIGILASMAMPSLHRYQHKARIKEQAYLVADLLFAAQEQTLAEQNIYGVVFGSTDASLITYGESYEGQDFTVEETKVLRSGVSMSNNTIVDGESGENLVRFSRAGTPSTTGSVAITYESSADPSYTVEVSPSGAIKVTQTP